MIKEILVVGAGPAGTSAALQSRKLDKRAKVTLLTEEPHSEYSRCGLPYVVSGTVSSLESLISHPPEFYECTSRIKLMLRTRGYEIDSSGKIASVKNLETGNEDSLHYDSLILACGGRPVLPSVRGVDKEGVFTIRTIEEVRSLLDHLKVVTVKSAVIIGAGLIGMEMSEALLKKGLKVTVVEILPEILQGFLDPDMAAIIRQRAEQAGVKILTDAVVEEILGDKRVRGVKVSTGEIETETVVIAAKVKPNVDLAERSGIRIGNTGAIDVDEYMRTSVEGIYAAGDCVETRDVVSGRKTLIQLATIAVRQGLVAGANALGGHEKYLGSTGVCTTELFGIEVASAGITTRFASDAGMSLISARVSAPTRPTYFPSRKDCIVKLISNRRDERLVGVQIIGEDGVSERANLAAHAIHMQQDVNQFAKMETCYAPPVASVWDPLFVATQALTRKLEVEFDKRLERLALEIPVHFRSVAAEKLVNILINSPNVKRMSNEAMKRILFNWQRGALATEYGLQVLLEAALALEPERTMSLLSERLRLYAPVLELKDARIPTQPRLLYNF